MALRWGNHAAVLFCLWSAGCAQPAARRTDPQQQRWDETGKRLRSELLLVNRARLTSDPSSSESIKHAMEATVAIRVARATNETRPSSPVGSALSAAMRTGVSHVFGTGTVIDRDGFILTNEHVVREGADIEVFVADRGWLRATVVGADRASDLAVLHVDWRMPAAWRFGDAATVHIGNQMMAFGGTSWDSDQPKLAAQTGRISATRRCVQGALDPSQRSYYGSMLECDIPLPRGFSGGPLVNAEGNVVGINTAAAPDRQNGRRLGYAIPLSTHTRTIIDRLMQGGRIESVYLGLLVRVSFSGPGEGMPRARTGIFVERVLRGSPAARAGICSGDVITRVGSAEVERAAQLAEHIRRALIGRPLNIQIVRSGRALTIPVIPTARDS